MFSKYRKPGGKPDTAGAAPEAAPKAKVDAPAPPPESSAGGGEAPIAARKPQELSAVPKADLSGGDDKEAKRRQRLDEIKTEMHHRLLDNLNLSALETPRKASCAPRSPRSRASSWPNWAWS
jgi:pilus assembly protein CpaF